MASTLPAISAMIVAAVAMLSPADAQAAVTTTDDITAYFRVMWGLLIVVAVILVLFALFKKRFSIINPRSTRAIRILEMQPLMPRKALYLVEVRGKEYLLGVSNEAITLLADLDASQKPSFQEVLDDSQNGQHS